MSLLINTSELARLAPRRAGDVSCRGAPEPLKFTAREQTLTIAGHLVGGRSTKTVRLADHSITICYSQRLQIGTPTSVVVRWQTSAAITRRVQFGPSRGVVSGSAEETSVRANHEVRLTSLTPDTLYLEGRLGVC